MSGEDDRFVFADGQPVPGSGGSGKELVGTGVVTVNAGANGGGGGGSLLYVSEYSTPEMRDDITGWQGPGVSLKPGTPTEVIVALEGQPYYGEANVGLTQNNPVGSPAYLYPLYLNEGPLRADWEYRYFQYGDGDEIRTANEGQGFPLTNYVNGAIITDNSLLEGSEFFEEIRQNDPETLGVGRRLKIYSNAFSNGMTNIRYDVRFYIYQAPRITR